MFVNATFEVFSLFYSLSLKLYYDTIVYGYVRGNFRETLLMCVVPSPITG